MRSQKEPPKAVEFSGKWSVSFLAKVPRKKIRGVHLHLESYFSEHVEKYPFPVYLYPTTSHPQTHSLPSQAHRGLVYRWWEVMGSRRRGRAREQG